MHSMFDDTMFPNTLVGFSKKLAARYSGGRCQYNLYPSDRMYSIKAGEDSSRSFSTYRIGRYFWIVPAALDYGDAQLQAFYQDLLESFGAFSTSRVQFRPSAEDQTSLKNRPPPAINQVALTL